MGIISRSIIEKELEFCETYYAVRLFLNESDGRFSLDRTVNFGDRTIYSGELEKIYIALKAYMEGLEDMQYWMSQR